MHVAPLCRLSCLPESRRLAGLRAQSWNQEVSTRILPVWLLLLLLLLLLSCLLACCREGLVSQLACSRLLVLFVCCCFCRGLGMHILPVHLFWQAPAAASARLCNSIFGCWCCLCAVASAVGWGCMYFQCIGSGRHLQQPRLVCVTQPLCFCCCCCCCFCCCCCCCCWRLCSAVCGLVLIVLIFILCKPPFTAIPVESLRAWGCSTSCD